MKNLISKRKLLIVAASAAVLFAIIFMIYRFTFSVTGTPVTDKVIYPDAMAWDYVLLYNYKGYDYSVTKNVIPSNLIDKKITYAGWNTVGGEGYDVYSIKYVWNYNQIAVKTKHGYLLANKGGKTLNIAYPVES